MKRITYPGDYCEDIAYCDNNCGGSCIGKRLWEKLRAYEDTGLTPEEIRGLATEILKRGDNHAIV